MNKLNPTFKDTPFSQLLTLSKELSDARQEYSTVSRKERQATADYQYHSAIASQMFDFDTATGGESKESQIPPEVLALAIDPNFAPAILTVGSYEFEYGRPEHAMELFFKLIDLPKNTDDIKEIIDKAGDYLLDKEDFENAKALYLKAVNRYPKHTIFISGVGYCYSKLGDQRKALEQSRNAVNMEPDNCLLLNDLGWDLVEAEEYDEAKEVIEKAIRLSPEDYDLPQKNLEELSRRMKKRT